MNDFPFSEGSQDNTSRAIEIAVAHPAEQVNAAELDILPATETT